MQATNIYEIKMEPLGMRFQLETVLLPDFMPKRPFFLWPVSVKLWQFQKVSVQFFETGLKLLHVLVKKSKWDFCMVNPIFCPKYRTKKITFFGKKNWKKKSCQKNKISPKIWTFLENVLKYSFLKLLKCFFWHASKTPT